MKGSIYIPVPTCRKAERLSKAIINLKLRWRGTVEKLHLVKQREPSFVSLAPIGKFRGMAKEVVLSHRHWNLAGKSVRLHKISVVVLLSIFVLTNTVHAQAFHWQRTQLISWSEILTAILIALILLIVPIRLVNWKDRMVIRQRMADEDINGSDQDVSDFSVDKEEMNHKS